MASQSTLEAACRHGELNSYNEELEGIGILIVLQILSDRPPFEALRFDSGCKRVSQNFRCYASQRLGLPTDLIREG